MRRKSDPTWLVFAAALFELTAFLLISIKAWPVDVMAIGLGFALPVVLIIEMSIADRFWPGSDRLLLVLVHFLCCLGILIQYRLEPAVAIRQAVFYCASIAAMFIAVVVVRRTPQFRVARLLIPLMVLSWVFLITPSFIGQWVNGVKRWISVGGFLTIQPSELVKISLILVMASVFSERRKTLRNYPAAIFLAGCVGIIMLQRDLGSVLIYFAASLLMYYAATSDLLITMIGIVVAAGGAVLAYSMYSHVQLRVAMWQNPWAAPLESGYQIVQALMAIGSGGMFGLGFGLGLPRSIPAYQTDFIYAVLCEEFGIVVGMCVVALYVIILLRGVSIAARAKMRFHALLAFGVTAILAVQTFIILAGVIKMIPLTGVTLPFISYGGSSLLSSLLMVGILQGISSISADQQAEAWRRQEEADNA